VLVMRICVDNPLRLSTSESAIFLRKVAAPVIAPREKS
jgi:hypothetical protein